MVVHFHVFYCCTEFVEVCCSCWMFWNVIYYVVSLNLWFYSSSSQAEMDELAPGEAVYYTWAEPTGSRILSWKWGKYKGELKSEEVRNKNLIWWLIIQHLIVINCIHFNTITKPHSSLKMCNLMLVWVPVFICSIGPVVGCEQGGKIVCHLILWRPPACGAFHHRAACLQEDSR